MLFSLILTLTLSSFSVLSVSNPVPATTTDKYDDLPTGLPVAGLGTKVGPYNGLSYSSFTAVGSDPLTKTHGGVIPQSQPNLAGGLASSQLQGFTITTNYTGSPYKTYDLKSFFFGCDELSEEGIASVALGCTLSVVGFYPNGGQTQQVVGGFFANNPESAPVVQVVLPSAFNGINRATFGVDTSAVTPATTNFFLDDLVHVNHP